MDTRKRGVDFLLEKPLASRLRFEREHTDCLSRIVDSCQGAFPLISGPVEKRHKGAAAADITEAERGGRGMTLCAPQVSEENDTEEVFGEAAADVEPRGLMGGIGGWLGLSRRSDQPEAGCGGTRYSERSAETGDPGESNQQCPSKLVGVRVRSPFWGLSWKLFRSPAESLWLFLEFEVVSKQIMEPPYRRRICILYFY